MEKFDGEIAERIVDALTIVQDMLSRRFDSAIQKILEAKSIAKVMEAKQELMSAIVQALPIQDDTCYFCIYDHQHRDILFPCEKCSYGRVHGKCGRGIDNSWKILCQMKLDLICYINSKYWTGGELENAEHQRHQDRQVEDTCVGKT